jgi:hypothetical protein
MRDHLRFTKDLIRLRRDLPALRSDNVHAFYQSDTRPARPADGLIAGNGGPDRSPDYRNGSQPDMAAPLRHVRSTPVVLALLYRRWPTSLP